MSRFLSIFLSLILAGPLCCCGFAVGLGLDTAKSELPGCPMCHVDDTSANSNEASEPACQCQGDSVLRDLAPAPTKVSKLLEQGDVPTERFVESFTGRSPSLAPWERCELTKPPWVQEHGLYLLFGCLLR